MILQNSLVPIYRMMSNITENLIGSMESKNYDDAIEFASKAYRNAIDLTEAVIEELDNLKTARNACVEVPIEITTEIELIIKSE